MFKTERQNQIYALLVKEGYISVKNLSESLYTSESSIRRDLIEMEKQGLIRRSYGGAEALNGTVSVLPFKTRSFDYVAEKQKIAVKAAELINKGDVVFLDQSSTSFFLARALMNKKGITVVSNNLEILNLLSHCEMTVISSGGIISKANNNCLFGENASKTFEGIFADFAFFSARSLGCDGVISDYTLEETFVRNSMLRNASKKVFLCNAQKFNTRSNFVQCSLSEIDILITDEKNTTEVFKERFKSLEIL